MKADNRTDRKLINAQVAIGDYIVSLGDLPANETKTMTISRGQGTSLKNFVSMHAQGFQSAVSSRQRAFGQTESGRITDLPNGSIAASFLSPILFVGVATTPRFQLAFGYTGVQARRSL